MNYYQTKIEDIFKDLDTSQRGLSEHQALFRLQKYGLNKLATIKATPLIFKFFSQFKDLLAIILMIAALIALIVGDSKDCLIILTIVLINATIGFIQEFKAERLLAAFKRNLPSYAKVVRNGKVKKVLTFQIVPGDILFLEAGDTISADARIIEAFNFRTNDFSLTGESHPQTKKAYKIKNDKMLADIDNMVYMGTSVADGEAKAIVVETAMKTEFGKIADESQRIKEEMTPLQKELLHTGKTVGKIALGVAVFILILMYLLGKDMNESLLFAIAAGVAMVPEGLPAAVSVALSLGAQRMLKRKALVKKLLHVESLGAVTTICTDKTGTITTGKMKVINVHLSDEKEKTRQLFFKNSILCNSAVLDHQSIGDPLELALLQYAQENKYNTDEIRQNHPKVYEIPFSSIKKMMSVAVQENEDVNVFVKGAVQEIIPRSKISEAKKEEIIKINDDMAKKGLRVIAFAYKKAGGKDDYSLKNINKDLTFLGLAGLEDPPREGVANAIEICRKAKIKVIMITGDYGLTALSISKEIGLADENTRVITGLELHQMDDEKLRETCQKEVIFARIDPGQKLRIVENLQEMGEIVAVTGDGVNDVPALVKADIGVAMGKIGTDVTKEAADMVLLDDHFGTIVNAIEEGRRIFDNAKKFVFYVFSSNAGELFAPLFGILLGLPLPLIAVQILAIDLGTDVLPSLALGVEKAEPNIMERPPRPKTERIMNIKILVKLLEIGLVMGALGLAVYLISLFQTGWKWGDMLAANSPIYWQAMGSVYATIVFCQVANAFSCRSEKLSIFKIGIFSNIWLIFAEIVSFIMLWGVIGFKPLQDVFQTNWPSNLTWICIFASFFIFLIIFEARKKILHKDDLKA